MKKNMSIRMIGAGLALTTLISAGAFGLAAETALTEKAAVSVLPELAADKAGVTVYSNRKASVDASNLTEGYLKIRYTGGKKVRIKVQITKSGGVTYTYDLNNKGTEETFPLTEGDGEYSVKVFENVSGTRYAQAYATQVTMALRSGFLPFLYPSQYVNYTEKSQTVIQGKTVTQGLSDDLDKVAAIYAYVVDTISYDYQLAATVESGYLPDVDKVLASQKGICFDYAALMAAMLRSQGIPTQLVVGYAGDIYHAWLNVYIESVGWVEKVIYFDGKDWTLMDPTFTSTGKRSGNIMKYVTDESNYQKKYIY